MLGTTSSGIPGQLRDKVNNMVKYARKQFFINVNDMLDNEVKSNTKGVLASCEIIMAISTSSSMFL